jgi:hypothetical protein
MEMVTISNPLPDGKGSNFKGQRAILLRKNKDTVVVKGLTGTYGAECIFDISEVTFDKGTMYFKDEGDYFTYKLIKGTNDLADPNEMYEYGTLETCIATTKKHARELAKRRNLTAVFG